MMKSTKAYAIAFLDLCNEQHSKEEAVKELQLVSSHFDDDFIRFLSYPKISKNEKKEVFTKSFNISKLTLSFLYVLIDNNDILDLNNIIKEIENLIMQENGQAIVTVEVMKSLDENQRNLIISNLTKKLNKQIILKEIINTNLIGGIIIKYEGKVIDGSLITKQQSLKEYLKK